MQSLGPQQAPKYALMDVVVVAANGLIVNTMRSGRYAVVDVKGSLGTP